MSSYINRSSTYNVDTREKIIALWSTGHLQKDIAKTLHLPHQRVLTIIDRFVWFGLVQRCLENPVGKQGQFQRHK